jgi:hypothetical protein
MSDLKLSKSEINDISRQYKTDNVGALDEKYSKKTKRDEFKENGNVIMAILAIAGVTYFILRSHQNAEGEVMIYSA